MPGLEIAVPIEFAALEAGFIVGPRLVDIDLVAEQEARDIGQPRVGGEPCHHGALRVNLEDRPDLPALRLGDDRIVVERGRSEEHTSELQSLMRISYAVFCLKKKS